MQIITQICNILMLCLLFTGCGYKADPYWDTPKETNELLLP